jgi:hypothetical protein
MLQRKDEAARACHGSDERRSVPARHRRAHRRAEADARSRTSVEVPVASRPPSRTCATGARRPRCTRMQFGRLRQPPCQGRNSLAKGYRLPAPAHEPRRPAFPCSQKVPCFAYARSLSTYAASQTKAWLCGPVGERFLGRTRRQVTHSSVASWKGYRDRCLAGSKPPLNDFHSWCPALDPRNTDARAASERTKQSAQK